MDSTGVTCRMSCLRPLSLSESGGWQSQSWRKREHREFMDWVSVRRADWTCKVSQEGKTKRPIILVTNITCWRWERMGKLDWEREKIVGTTHARLGHSGPVVSDSLGQSYSVCPRAFGHSEFRKSHCLWYWGLRDAICPFSLNPKVPRRREKQRLSQPFGS